jgi:hypothetical protein
MSQQELMPYEDRASYSEINSYQRKIGSLLYAAVTTRPDIAFHDPQIITLPQAMLFLPITLWIAKALRHMSRSYPEV